MGAADRVPFVPFAAPVSVVSQVLKFLLLLLGLAAPLRLFYLPLILYFNFCSLGRWAYSSASAAALKVIGFISRTLRIQTPPSTAQPDTCDSA